MILVCFAESYFLVRYLQLVRLIYFKLFFWLLWKVFDICQLSSSELILSLIACLCSLAIVGLVYIAKSFSIYL